MYQIYKSTTFRHLQGTFKVVGFTFWNFLKFKNIHKSISVCYSQAFQKLLNYMCNKLITDSNLISVLQYNNSQDVKEIFLQKKIYVIVEGSVLVV